MPLNVSFHQAVSQTEESFGIRVESAWEDSPVLGTARGDASSSKRQKPMGEVVLSESPKTVGIHRGATVQHFRNSG